MKVLLFADPGIDDSLAIIYALLHPEIELLGIVTGYGNVSVFDATRNASFLLELAGRSDIPVVRGTSQPLSGIHTVFYPEIHGPQGLGPIIPPEEFKAEVSPFELMFEIIEENIEDIVIVDVGRQTSLAFAFNLRPELMDQVKEVYLMGGAFMVPGNVTDVAETNFWGDPIATSVILNKAKKVYITPLNVTNRAIVTRDIATFIFDQTSSPYKYLIPAVTNYYATFYDQVMPGIDGSPVHDVFTLYYLLNKDKTYTIQRDVRVAVVDGNRGQSIADLRMVYKQPQREHYIAMDFDYNDFINDFIEVNLRDASQ
ncbi:nucleoside hydrolase [Sutcliffiella horikoshii]|uniref:Nucleoside hydrolase n=1 Tax=Sutcliffiella horikoshii TaxID=79883 RepID=A0A5D4TC35_9BACI|nr:nucleoside hydrolase [Sutcliffiella horikoshii]TYS72929.1 nucleoside hydrolase [Sutcliffiella horikoshii]